MTLLLLRLTIKIIKFIFKDHNNETKEYKTPPTKFKILLLKAKQKRKIMQILACYTPIVATILSSKRIIRKNVNSLLP